MGTRKSYAGGAVATRLAADITAGATTIVVADASTYPSSSNPFVIAINRGSSSEEKVLIGSRSGNNLTVTTRGYDGTSALAHITNEVVEHVLDAVSIDEANAFANVMTTRGDQVVYGASGATRVPKGTSGQVWTMVDGNDPGWVDASETQAETAWVPAYTGTLVLGTGTGLYRSGGYSIQNGMLTGWFSIVAGTTGFTAGTLTSLDLPVPLRSTLPASTLTNRLAVGSAMFGGTNSIPALLSYFATDKFFPYRTSDAGTSPVSAFSAASNVLSGFLSYPVD
jgi:hypothetical protein